LTDPIRGDAIAKFAYLSLANPQEAPLEFQKDRTDTPPRLTTETVANAIQLSLDNTSCDPIEFPQPSATYRLMISETGSVLRATRWTGGGMGTVGAPAEDAVGCLIRNAGFTFEPAILDGAPWVSDNLLVTVQLIESTGE